jgi:outer membrane protein assembly factor BamE (lipoprotein component of BamABCDE complex)
MFVVGIITSACSLLPAPQTRGNKMEPDQLAQLVIGTSTRSDVTVLVGTPTQKAAFDEDTWIYVTETTRARLGQTLGILDQQAVTLTFDKLGILRKVKKVDLPGSETALFASRNTPSPGTEASFMQQLLGNIGKFNALGAGPTSAGGGAPTTGSGL